MTQTLYNRMDLLLKEEDHDIAWLLQALQWAVELEFTTIPPYLYALWSIKDQDHEVANMIGGIVMEEMLHMALACNMLTAIGGVPEIADHAPTYPGKLPAKVDSQVEIHLLGLSARAEDPEDVVRVFMEIETSEQPLARAEEAFATIGQFYAAIRKAFHDPANTARFGTPGKQAVRTFGENNDYDLVALTKEEGGREVVDLEKVDDAIHLITEQGEGSTTSPNSDTGLAHYYRYGEIYHGRRLVEHDDGGEVTWRFDGAPLARPPVHELGRVPAGGWGRNGMATEVESALDAFNSSYRTLTQELDSAWRESGDDQALDEAIRRMADIQSHAQTIIKFPLPPSEGQPGKLYGPEFRVV